MFFFSWPIFLFIFIEGVFFLLANPFICFYWRCVFFIGLFFLFFFIGGVFFLLPNLFIHFYWRCSFFSYPIFLLVFIRGVFFSLGNLFRFFYCRCAASQAVSFSGRGWRRSVCLRRRGWSLAPTGALVVAPLPLFHITSSHSSKFLYNLLTLLKNLEHLCLYI